MTTAFLCVTIDCECDKGPRWRTELPLSFTGVTVGIAEKLHPLFARFGVKPTYLLSSEVMSDAASVEVLRSLEGAELGTHLHGEFVGNEGAPRTTSEFQRD